MKNKIYSLKNLAKILQREKKKSKIIVHCHGVFDLLHVGHIKHLKKAKELGDKLVNGNTIVTKIDSLNKNMFCNLLIYFKT